MNEINENNIDNSLNDKNHLQDIINIAHILNKNNEHKSLIEKNDTNTLFYFFSNKEKLYNNKGTKPLNKDTFMNLIYILKEYINQNEDYILFYFMKIKIDIIKVIINGYIIFEWEEKDKNEIYNFIINIIPYFFDKNIFYYIYNKLSKIFRTFTFSENKKLLFEKFNKIFDIWKLLYKVENISKVNESYIAFLGNKNGLILDFNQFKKRSKINSIIINIEFSPHFEKKYIDEKNFCFLKTYYNNIEAKEVKIIDIKFNSQEKINKINLKITPNFYNYNINENLEEIENKNIIMTIPDSKSEIEKIEILKNYIGTIKSIHIFVEYNKNKNKIEFDLTLKDNFQKGQKCYKIESFSNFESNDKDENMQLYFTSKDEKIISYKKMNEIFYEDINYYGGTECFIPILKIIKYFIVEFKDDSKKIITSYRYIIQIMKIIINIICYSKKNFINFKKIFTSLIGALAEINHGLPENYQKELYSDNIFSTLYIIIISSSFSLAQKKAYILITGLNEVDNLTIKLDDLLINFNLLETSCLQWYGILLYIYIECILLIFNDHNKVPKILYEQLIKLDEIVKKRVEEETQIGTLIKLFIGSLKYICEIKEENNILKNYQKVKDVKSFLDEQSNIFETNEYYIYIILYIIETYFYLIDFYNIFQENEKMIKNDIINQEKLELKNSMNKKDNDYNNIINIEDNKYAKKFLILFDSLKEIIKTTNFENIDKNFKYNIYSALKDFINHKEYLIKIFDMKDEQGFYFESEKIIKEFTDYHGDYHKLMKRLFIYNKLWSDKKLYYNEEKKKLLKYKYINYYTTNFQRPLLFPVNDYKNKYPCFQKYQIKENFYIIEENKDNYNFYLDCPELDEFTIKYEQEIIKKIEMDYQIDINSYDACFVKKTHHVKGKLFVLTKNGLIKKFVFYCYPYDIAEKIPSCNVLKEIENVNLKKQKLCFGQTFPCPKYDMNKKIIIDIRNVRLILRRIYFYRKTAIEIFTVTKSYYFNFAEDFNINNSKKGENNCLNIINQMGFYYQTDFFPININDQLLGYSKDFGKIVKKYAEQKNNNLLEIKNKFISVLFDHFKPNEKDTEYSSLDMIIYLNLLSNRSYNDLFQYPVFPVLFLYEKEMKKEKFIYKERELSKHIGFQEISEKSAKRTQMVKDTYIQTIKENEEIEDETLESENPFYFQTHYSNNVYTSNYLIRFFPFSFLSIEFQGNNFDNPNRLFFSIEETFFNISSQKSDVRELIPEFYYFPEMFLNINKINFDKRTNGQLVDDVIIPKNLDIIGKYLNENNNNNKNNCEEDKAETPNNLRCFKFVEKMRNLLESKTNDINNWINLIFGTKTKYKSSRKKDQYFRPQSYIDFSDEKEKEFQNYINNKDIMLSVDFGISPVQTLFKKKEILDYFNRNIIYDKKVKDNKELSQSIYNDFISTMDELKDKNKKIKKKSIDFGRTSKLSYVNRYSKSVEYNSINSNSLDYFRDNKEKKENKEFNSSKNIVKFFYNKKDIIGLIGYKTGKVDIIIKKQFYGELYDHNEEITCIHYNERLNMFCTTSKDGFLNLYIFPNKLMTSIKNPNGNYFNIAFLSSNPFPSIIAFDEKSYELFSYSINGFFINKDSILNLLGLKERKSNLEIYHKFNEKGGTYKDRLIFIEENIKGKSFKCQLFTLPFFEKEEKKYEIKRKINII